MGVSSILLDKYLEMHLKTIYSITKILLTIICSINGQEDEGPLESKECREKDRLVTSEKEDSYALVDALEGQTLILMCRFCNEPHSDLPKNWYKIDQLGLSPPHEVQLGMSNDPKDNRISVNHKHSLIISNFSGSDMGFYYCVHFEDQTNEEKFNYLVDLVYPDKYPGIERGSINDWAKYHDAFFESINNLFKSSDASEFVYLREILRIDAEMLTQWAPWEPCQACGRPQGDGIRKKKGSCRIKLNPYGGSPAKNLTTNEIFLFKAPAISCRSKKLEMMFPQISNYTRILPDFFLEDRCTAECNPDAEGWKLGKGKGFKYRKTSVLQEGSHLTFICPESTLDNKVVWKKNGKKLSRGDNSNSHLIVDTFNTLYLIEVTVSDKGNYTCYVDDIRMQQIVIFVYSKSKILTSELLRYLVYLGFILFLSSFCYCAGLIITWKRRHLFKTYEELKEEDPKRRAEEEEMESLI